MLVAPDLLLSIVFFVLKRFYFIDSRRLSGASVHVLIDKCSPRNALSRTSLLKKLHFCAIQKSGKLCTKVSL